jgi:L-glutamine-phosphate cytidylyltransferase
MNVIILAAGMGTRLGSITRDIPKALIAVMGKELVRYIVGMALYVNVSKIIVVGGCGFNNLKAFLEANVPEAIVTENPDYKKGNIYSLKCALPFINEDFLIFNVDHVFSKDLLNIIIRTCDASKEITVFCDNIKHIEEDQMKVSANGNRLQKISKKMKSYDTGYIGLVYCPKVMTSSFIKATNAVMNKNNEDAMTEDILNYLVSEDKFIKVADVGGYKWFEVDTLEDLSQAEELVSGFPEKWA